MTMLVTASIVGWAANQSYAERQWELREGKAARHGGQARTAAVQSGRCPRKDEKQILRPDRILRASE